MLRDEARLVHRLAIALRAEGNELLRHRDDTGGGLPGLFGHGPDHPPSRATPRTRLVRLHRKLTVFIHAKRCHGDLPERECEGVGDALRAKWTGKVPEKLRDLLAECYRHSLNSARRGSAAFGSKVSARSQGQDGASPTAWLTYTYGAAISR